MPGNLDPPSRSERRDFADLSVALVAGLAFAVGTLFIAAVPLAGHLAAARDFVSYWATGSQLARHANPYDRDAVAHIEHSAGLDARAVLIMRNPPWALPLAYPLGFVGLRLGAILWTFLLLSCLLASARILYRLHGSPSNHLHWLALSFTPGLICLTMGQTTLLALLGLVVFLRLHISNPFVAGLALWLCALKPHLFLPFAAVLLLWILRIRSYKILAGAATSILISTGLAFLIAPHAWSDYIALMRSPAVENDFIPCISVAARQWLHIRPTWPQYMLAALSSVWALYYFWQRREGWDWLRHSSPLMLASIVAAPYCWFYDQCLLIPAVLDGLYATRNRRMIVTLALLILVTDLQLCFLSMTSPIWLWTAPAWLLWYWFAEIRSTGIKSKSALSPAR